MDRKNEIICLVGIEAFEKSGSSDNQISNEKQLEQSYDVTPIVRIDKFMKKKIDFNAILTKTNKVYIYTEKCKILSVAMLKFKFCSSFVYKNNAYSPPQYENISMSLSEKEKITIETCCNYNYNWFPLFRNIVGSRVKDIMFGSNCEYKYPVGLRIEGIKFPNNFTIENKKARVEIYIINKWLSDVMIDVSKIIENNSTCDFIFYRISIKSQLPRISGLKKEEISFLKSVSYN